MDIKGQEILSHRMKASKRRTYFFDVRETVAGDYYLTITESKKTYHEDKAPTYKKSKVFLYKENFDEFLENVQKFTEYIYKEKGKDVISNYNADERRTYSEKKETTSGEKQNSDTLEKLDKLDFDSLDK